MIDYQILAHSGLTGKILFPLSLPLFFVVLRSLLRRREERRVVRTPT